MRPTVEMPKAFSWDWEERKTFEDQNG